MKHFASAHLSVVQSGIEHVLVSAGHAQDEVHAHALMLAANQICEHRHQRNSVPTVPPRSSACHPQTWGVVRLYEATVKALVERDWPLYDKLKQRLQFSPGDLEWAQALIDYLDAFGIGRNAHRIPYVDWQATTDGIVDGLDEDLTIGIIGDWGTGTQIAEGVLDRLVTHQPDIIVHLGDVYYAGTSQQVERKLLNVLDRKARRADGRRIPVFNLAGNHDMYSGGNAFYAALPRLNVGLEPRFRQRASYFGLRLADSSWQVLATDTAYHDHDPFTVKSALTFVRPREADWLEAQVASVAARGGRTILLSHHQPFSAFEAIGSLSQKSALDFYTNPKLLALHERLSQCGSIAAWLWGHEHRFAVYDSYRGVGKGRCIGHGAVPVLTAEDDYSTHRAHTMDLAEGLIGIATGHGRPQTLRSLASLFGRVFKGDIGDAPRLVQVDGRPLELDVDDLSIMYRHGYAVLRFAKVGGTTTARIDYHDDVVDAALYSETL